MITLQKKAGARTGTVAFLKHESKELGTAQRLKVQKITKHYIYNYIYTVYYTPIISYDIYVYIYIYICVCAYVLT